MQTECVPADPALTHHFARKIQNVANPTLIWIYFLKFAIKFT